MRLIITGTGVMGTLVKEAAESEGIEIIAFIKPDQLNMNMEADALIDFSHPEGLKNILDYSIATQTPVVLATTGYDNEHIALIEKASMLIPVLQSYNLSTGVGIVQKLLEYASSLIDESFDIEIVEKHHRRKIDAPSGTALLLLDSLNREKNPHFGYHELGRKRSANDVGIHSVRGGTIFGEHIVCFAGEDEIIEIKHEALSRRIFASGAIRGAKMLIGKKVGYYKLKDLL